MEQNKGGVRKRKSYPEKSIIMWMHPGEKFSDAEARLAQAWKDGCHPEQIAEERKAEARRRKSEKYN